MFDVWSIGRGILAGVTYSLTAFSKKEKQKFDWNKFGTTVLIGGLAGLVMAILDMPVESGYEFLVGLGAVPVIENLWKMLWRKVIAPRGF